MYNYTAFLICEQFSSFETTDIKNKLHTNKNKQTNKLHDINLKIAVCIDIEQWCLQFRPAGHILEYQSRVFFNHNI